MAIIALLVAILLPSLQEARALAEAAVCGVNLKQIGTVWHLYVQDYDGSFFGSGGADNWMDALYSLSYITTVGFAGDPNAPYTGALLPRTREGTFLCPGNPNYRCSDRYYYAPFNYAMNWNICFWAPPNKAPYYSYRLLDIYNPSNTILHFDSAELPGVPGSVYTVASPQVYGPIITTYVGTPHDDRANIIMVDTHVETASEEELDSGAWLPRFRTYE